MEIKDIYEQLWTIDNLAEYASHEMNDLDKSFPDFCTEEKELIHEVMVSLDDIRDVIRNWPSEEPTANCEQRIESAER